MRISDWSSDVCSSDLPADHRRAGEGRSERQNRVPRTAGAERRKRRGRALEPGGGQGGQVQRFPRSALCRRADHRGVDGGGGARRGARSGGDRQSRSEEHTSELQSLMRISYAVFCLKKKQKRKPHKIRLGSNRNAENQTITYT